MIHQKICGPAEALRHATVNNAAVVRMKGQVGEITRGSHADLVIVDANPFDGLECFSQNNNKVVGVIKSGRLIRDDLALFASS